MAISPDHPNVIVKRDGKRFLLGKEKGEEEIKADEIEEKDGYAIYRPKEKGEYSHNMMIITDFDKAVLYETLENMAVLSNIAKEKEQYILPKAKREGMEIAEKHQKLLLSANWHHIQQKLFPDMVNAFKENEKEWSEETTRMKAIREKQHLARIIKNMFDKGLDNLGTGRDNLKSILPKIMARSFPYKVFDYIEGKAPLDTSAPEDVHKFWSGVKTVFDEQDEEEKFKLLNTLHEGLPEKEPIDSE